MKYGTIKVEYDDHFGSDLKVVNAARVSFGKRSSLLPDGSLKQADANLIRFLARGVTSEDWDNLADDILAMEDRADVQNALKQWKASAVHFAPFCHSAVTLRLDIPVFVARQLVKHQIGGTLNEVSRRYVDEEPSFWFPNAWHIRPENVKQGAGEQIADHMQAFKISHNASEISLAAYNSLLNLGVAPEEARIVLTLNHMTSWYWTGTLLFWTRVANQRKDPHAQLATRLVARDIEDIIKPLFPVSWDALVAF